ncbi:MAG: ECF transporter S component [Candidatus Bathyarchaeota archaeon]
MSGHRNSSVAIAITAVFSAMAVAITLSKLTIPFPPLPYLKFDLSEVPVTVAMMYLGPVHGLLSAVIYWLVLTMRAGDILGPAMKFAAVASMIIGFWVASVITNRLHNKNLAPILVSGFLVGSILRALVMSIFNYVVLLYIAPYYIDFIGPLLASLGLPSKTTLDVIIWSLLLTAIYNIVHSAVSIFPAYLLTKASLKRVPNIVGSSWIVGITEDVT